MVRHSRLDIAIEGLRQHRRRGTRNANEETGGLVDCVVCRVQNPTEDNVGGGSGVQLAVAKFATRRPTVAVAPVKTSIPGCQDRTRTN